MKKAIIYFICLALLLAFPVPASAEEVSPEPQEEEISSAPLAMDLTAKDIYIKNSDVIYKDL